MRVCAALMWFSEPVTELVERVHGLEGFADRLVAVDGRWDGFGDGPAASSFDEAEALMRTAEGIGIDCTVHRPARCWPGEVSHRNYILRLALADATWVYLMDGDEQIVQLGGDTRERLETTDLNVATVRFFTPQGWHPSATGWEKPGETSEQRRVFRASPDLRIENWHWHLRTDREALWGPIAGLPFAEAKPLDMTVEHRTCQRSEERWRLKDAFRPIRDAADKARGGEL